jgi:hypothetical protein
MDSWDPQRQPYSSPSEGLVPEAPVKPAGPTPAPRGSSASGNAPPAGSTSLREAIRDEPKLKRALQRVRSNPGAPGGDGVTTAQLVDYLGAHWPTIRAELRAGTYRPQLVRGRETIGDPHGDRPGHPASRLARTHAAVCPPLLGLQLRVPAGPERPPSGSPRSPRGRRWSRMGGATST